jgi:DNA-binding transcriptional LysR family regulator
VSEWPELRACQAYVEGTQPPEECKPRAPGADTSHVHRTPDVRSRGEETDFVDAALARHKLARRVTLRVPLLAAAATLAQSEMVAILSERTARAFASSAPLEVLALPFVSPRQVTAMLWHRRVDNVPAHLWLRTLILRVARVVDRS